MKQLQTEENPIGENDKNDCQDKKIKRVHYLEMVIIVLIATVASCIFIYFYQISLLLNEVLLFFLFFLLICHPLYASFYTRNLINEYPEFNCSFQHHAIIIAHNAPQKSGKFTFTDYLSGADILIRRFRIEGRRINYKVYEVNKKEQIIPIILNEKTTHLWIFGHGMRNKLALFGGHLCYYEVRHAPKKVFIGQYHCNSFLGKSLGDYNKPTNQDISHFARMDPFIRISVWLKLKELERKGLL